MVNRFNRPLIPQNDATARAGSVVSFTVSALSMDKAVYLESVGVSTASTTIGKLQLKLDRSSYS
jgi:hypothetical protein